MSAMDEPDAKLLEERGRRISALGLPPPWWRVFARRRWIRQYRAIFAMSVSRLTALLRSIYEPKVIEELANRRTGPWLGVMRKPEGE